MEDYITCEVCDVNTAIEDSYRKGERELCSTCYDENFECYSCERLYPFEESILSQSGVPYCDSCYTYIFTICCNCDAEIFSESAIYEQGDNYCKECHTRLYDGESVIDRVLESSYAKPYIDKESLERNAGLLHFGIELELHYEDYMEVSDAQSFVEDLEQDTLYLTDRMITKSDSSVKGVEFCFSPFTIRELFLDRVLEKPLQLIKDSHCFQGRHEDAGVHIHINKSALTASQIRYINDFIAYMPKSLIDRIVGRPANHYCKRYTWNFNIDEDSRYVAVNLKNKNTIEIRSFDDTFEHETILSYIEFLCSVLDYQTTDPLMDCINDPSKYLSFLHFGNRPYKNLQKIHTLKACMDLI